MWAHPSLSRRLLCAAHPPPVPVLANARSLHLAAAPQSPTLSQSTTSLPASPPSTLRAARPAGDSSVISSCSCALRCHHGRRGVSVGRRVCDGSAFTFSLGSSLAAAGVRQIERLLLPICLGCYCQRDCSEGIRHRIAAYC
ncbi:unnamed protein product [Urochloa humidicola]